MMKLWFIIIIMLFFITIKVYATEESCNVSIEITTSKLFYDNESIDFKFKLNDKPSEYEIEYWVEDMFGNIVKSKKNTTNINKKSFTPDTGGVQAFLIKAKFVKVSCENTQDSVFEKIVLFKGDLNTENQCCTCPETKKGFYYEIVEIPNSIYKDEVFLVKVNLKNYDEEQHDIKVWSYVYRGSKVYSESREANVQQLILQPNTTLIVELENKAEVEPGEYKLKVKINKDNQKTNKELTTNITFIEKPSISNIPQLKITDLYFTSESPVKLFTVINNSFKDDLTIDVELSSIYSFQKKSVFVESESNALVSFDIELSEDKNPFFVKLSVNDTLVDVDEIIIDNNKISNNNQDDLPFQLVTGDMVFNSSRIVYESSTLKSLRIATYLFLVLSVVLNCVLLLRKKV